VRNALPLAILLSIATPVIADDWPQWLGPKRDSSSTEVVKPWKEPLKILWKQEVGVPTQKIEGYGGPVVAKGKVFLFYRTPGKDEETLAAFDADSGKEIWKTSYPRPKTDFMFGNSPRSSPAFVDGKIYTFGITSILTCFDADKGNIVWQVDGGKEYKPPVLRFGSSCSPIVVGDLVLVNIGAKGASIVAFDNNTGKEVWKKLDDGATYASPFLYDHAGTPRVVFLTAKGLVSLSPKDGAVHWQYPFVDLLLESSCTPMMIDGKLLASSITAGSVLLEEQAQGAKVAKIWAKPLNCYFSTPVAVGTDSIYMVTGDLTNLFAKKKQAVLRCIDAKTGDVLWSRKNVGTYHATLLRTGDNKMLLVEEAGDLVLFDPNQKEYRELSRSKICAATWAHPALANGQLYIRDAKELVCVELPK
jgi:outer membrane protein assembly factor BamB